MTASYLLDSWAMLAYLKKESPADARVIELLQQANQGSVRLYLSVINLGEIYYSAGRVGGERFADYALSGLRLLPLEIAPVDENLVLAAARWKTKYPISYADAFAVATAEALGAVLVTGDPELVALAEVVKLEKLERNRT